jgi:hypothetical protein
MRPISSRTFAGGANHTIRPTEIAPMIATPNLRQPRDSFLRFGGASAHSACVGEEIFPAFRESL